jgi:hypothetical protein
MYYLDYHLTKIVTDRRLDELRREAELHYLLSRAGAQRPGRLSRLSRWLLYQLGHAFSALGEWLHSPQASPACCFEGNLMGGP